MASIPLNQLSPHLASFHNTLGESIEALITSINAAYSHLQAVQQPEEIHESALSLMRIFDDVCRLQIHLPSRPFATMLGNVLINGTVREMRVGSFLLYQMYHINVLLCSAFQRLEWWELMNERVSMALDIATKHGEHCYIPREASDWLRGIRENPAQPFIMYEGG